MQKLLEVAQFKAIRGNLILVIIASYTLILELVNRSPFIAPFLTASDKESIQNVNMQLDAVHKTAHNAELLHTIILLIPSQKRPH